MTKNAPYALPDTFPDLSSAKSISVDLETRDDDLKEKGPGVRRDAYIIGVAVSTDDGFCDYYPVAHDQGPNLNKKAVFSWLRKELARPSQVKIGANLLYDFDFLAEQKVRVAGLWYDVNNAEPLIDENIGGRYNLGALGEKYVGETKDEAALEEYCALHGWKGDVQKHLWKMPASLVAGYARQDVTLPRRILKKQSVALHDEELWDLFILETKLSPILLDMRRLGVRIDETSLPKTIDEFNKKLKEEKRKLKTLAGFDVQYWAAESIAKAFSKAGVPYPLTPKTKKPSFTREWLEAHPHPLAKSVASCRTLDKFIGTFLIGSIQNQLINGRIHCLFNQLRSDEYGTVTGRFSSSHPNLQFIPARDPELGPLCRSLFIPEDRHLWMKSDYSQVEYRLFAHYAVGEGSEEFREQYRQNPNIDYHQWCADEAGTDRKKAKTVNFGVIYGMGLAALADKLNVTLDEARRFMGQYNEKLPFLKTTLQAVAERASSRGYVRTILNRRRRFIAWEPSDWELSREVSALRDQDEMIEIVNEHVKRARDNKKNPPRPGIRRAHTHKALNAVIQGSAADLIKKAMVDCAEAGIFDVLPLHLTVHDELDNSIVQDKRGMEAADEMKRLMENAIPFKVPIVVDRDVLVNWGGLIRDKKPKQ